MVNKNIRILLTISFFSFILLNPAEAICVPRNATSGEPSPSSGSPLNSTASPSHGASPSPESIPPPPSMVTPPQSSQVEPSPSPDSPLNSNASPYHKPSPSPELIPPPTSTVAPSKSSQATGADPPATNVEATNMLRGSLMQAGATNPAIEKVCNTTDYPALCISALTPFLTGKVLLAKHIALLEAAIKAATVETKLMMMVLGKLIETSHTDARTLMSLKDCHDNYSDMLDNFQAVMDAIPNRDIGTIKAC